MRYNNLKAFHKHLESAQPANLSDLYVLLAKDPGERYLILETLLPFLKKGLHAAATRTFRGMAPGLRDELEGFSLFSAQQLFIVHDAETLKKGDQTLLEALLKVPARGRRIVLTGASINRSSLFYKFLEKGGILCELGDEKTYEKEKNGMEWLGDQKGKAMEPAAMKALVKATGANLGLIASEYEKLQCYLGERATITLADVKILCPDSVPESIFAFSDAVVKKQAGAALKTGLELLESGESLFALLRFIRRPLQTAGRVSDVVMIDQAELSAKDGQDDHALLLTQLICKVTQ